MSAPLVTVVMATWNRGRHILPSVQSVLRQSFGQLELLVVGDGCSDNTAEVLASVRSPHLRWINLSRNGGSQSFANNAGIAAARGQYIAYIGHDDIWAPHHVDDLVKTMQSATQPDFAVAGTLLYGAPGSNHSSVTGLFDDPAAPLQHFFPPTSIMHHRDAIRRMGLWRAPWRCMAGVDSEFELRAAAAGLRFQSTHQISAHKFVASQRYLSYILKTSHEQEECLALAPEALSRRIAAEVQSAKAENRFMTLGHSSAAAKEKGDIWRINRMIRGLDIPPLKVLDGPFFLPQDNANRGLDWNNTARGNTYRWAGPSPRPRLLLPCCYDGPCRMTIEVFALAPMTGQKLAVSLNGTAVNHKLLQKGQDLFLQFEGTLKPDAASVVEFDAPHDPTAGPTRSFALGTTQVEPL